MMSPGAPGVLPSTETLAEEPHLHSPNREREFSLPSRSLQFERALETMAMLSRKDDDLDANAEGLAGDSDAGIQEGEPDETDVLHPEEGRDEDGKRVTFSPDVSRQLRRARLQQRSVSGKTSRDTIEKLEERLRQAEHNRLKVDLFFGFPTA